MPEVTLAHIQFFEWDEKCQDCSKQIRHSHTLHQNALVNERNHGFGFETEETKVVSVSTETNFGFLLTETH